MTVFNVSYESENQYDNEVQEALFEFLVVPCENQNQKVVWQELSNSMDSSPFYSRNVYGYDMLCFRISRGFQQFDFKCACKVEVNDETPLPDASRSLSTAEEMHILSSVDFQVDNFLFLHQSALTKVPLHLIPEGMRLRKDSSLFEYVSQLNTRVYEMITYTPNATTVNTKAVDVLASPVGVCQDYSHLLIGILRAQHIPARYVSGYLNQGKSYVGDARMHAWIEAYIPNMGWVGFDPTNNLLAHYHHIKVADGQDYNDCSPLRGFIRPSSINCTDHSVEVVEQ